MTGWLELALEHMGKFAGGVVLFIVVGVVIWLSPLGKVIDQFAEFREWKRNQRRQISLDYK